MACKGFWECLLKLLNFLLTLSGLAMVGYGVYLLIECNKVSSGGDGDDEAAPTSYDPKFWMIGRPMLLFFRVFSIISPKLGMQSILKFESSFLFAKKDHTKYVSLSVIHWIICSIRSIIQCYCRFIYLFIGVGAILFVISCFGCIGAVTRNGCCLSCVS
ncbi:hypothetical protein BHE74_00027377 [Ensete ventricosum]|nr:hypothetical protein BHE74_00027377 [Ensete ventricosum]RZS18157.1 hypothetical protein BHM03_00050384 [Ensete ventricosum]